MNALTQILTIGLTELRIEWRSRRVTTTMLLLGSLSVLVFAFAGGGTGLERAVPAFWVSLALAAAAGTAQWAARTAESGVGLAIHLGAAGGIRAFFGRLLALGTTLLVVALLLGVITATLFSALDPQRPLALLGALTLGTLGLAALGGALLPFLQGRRARLGPLLLLPLGAPLLLFATHASLAAYGAADPGWTLRLGLVVALLLVLGGVLAPLATEPER